MLKINQRAWVEMAALDAGTSIRYEVRIDTNGVDIFVVSGDVLIAGSSLHENDAIGLTGLEYADVEAETDAKILVIEVPMRQWSNSSEG